MAGLKRPGIGARAARHDHNTGAGVETHVRHIYGRLCVGDGSAAVACALRAPGYFK
jgi:hypothetical protein